MRREQERRERQIRAQAEKYRLDLDNEGYGFADGARVRLVAWCRLCAAVSSCCFAIRPKPTGDSHPVAHPPTAIGPWACLPGHP